MKTSEILWLAGDPALRPALDRALATGLDAATPIHRTARRSVHRLVLETDATEGERSHVLSIAAKIHPTGAGAHPTRERLKRWLGRSPAGREWRGMLALRAAQLTVPEPRAWGRFASGEEILISDFVEVQPLAEAFRGAEEAERATLVDRLARAIAALHGAGFVHGDLHVGNLGLDHDRVVFFDLQRTRRQRAEQAQLDDLARLELSLARSGWSPTWRRRLRERLSLGRDFDAALVRFSRDHVRGRARRVLNTDRSWAKLRIGDRRGLRDRELDPATLTRLFEQVDQRDALPPRDERRGGRTRVFEVGDGERRLIVKRSDAGTTRRALADRLRGSAASRGFRAGQRFMLLGAPVARPLAFLEDSRFGLPVRSWLVLERVGSEDLDAVAPETPAVARQLAVDLGGWLAELHAWGLGHRDLKAGNLRISRESGDNRIHLIDLEDLVGPGRLREDDRIEALAQLNASLDDAHFDVGTRLAALASYLERLPLGAAPEAAAAEIARRSLARSHRWLGRGCASARPGRV